MTPSMALYGTARMEGVRGDAVTKVGRGIRVGVFKSELRDSIVRVVAKKTTIVETKGFPDCLNRAWLDRGFY